MKKDQFRHKIVRKQKTEVKVFIRGIDEHPHSEKTLCQFYPLSNCLMLTKQFAGRVDLSIKLQTLKIC